MAVKILTLSLLFLLLGCSDNSMSQVYDKHILVQDIKCMRLLVFPPNKIIEQTLDDLYKFDQECELSLVVSYKDQITCNSNQNVDKKAQGMPSAYLRLEIKKGKKLYYSYYKDLDGITAEDVKDGFDKMYDQLNFKRQSR
jgi:hypothetical protein